MLFKKLNQAQLEKTADLSLEVAKTALLATVIGTFIPSVGEKAGTVGSIIGFIIFIACYFLAMWLLKEVKK